MMRVLSWLAGIFALSAVVLAFRPTGIDEALASIGMCGLGGWLVLTLVSRVLVVETAVRPLRHLGYVLGRWDAFWLGWLRTFANQVVPLSGLAFYFREIVRRTGMPWLEATSLATPQVFLGLVAVSGVGIVSVLCGYSILDEFALVLGVVYVLMLLIATTAALRADRIVFILPRSFGTAGAKISKSLRSLADSRYLLFILVGLHLTAILTRGCRIWLLFILVGVDVEWRQMLLIVAIAESATILQLTPGGLGLREGAIVGAALLTGVDEAAGVIVALADRLFMLGLTTLLAAPAIAWLKWRSNPMRPHA